MDCIFTVGNHLQCVRITPCLLSVVAVLKKQQLLRFEITLTIIYL